MFGVFTDLGLGLTTTKHVGEFRNSDLQRAGSIPLPIVEVGQIIFAPLMAEYQIIHKDVLCIK